MALNFPSSPTNGQKYTYNSVTYYYDSGNTSWTTSYIANPSIDLTPANNWANAVGTSGNNYVNTTFYTATNGAAAFAKANSANLLASNVVIVYVIDGGGSAITTGEKGYIEVPFPCSINNVTIMLDQSGSINVVIQKAAYANFPPVAANTINGSGFTVSTATKNQIQSSVITTTSIAAGDILGFNVASATTATRATVSIKATKT